MGKKGSWFSALKKVFSSGSKEKHAYGSEKKNSKEKKKGGRILKHGEHRSFIPLFREPSSIEKILGEADNQNMFIRSTTPSELPKTLAFPARTTSSTPSEVSYSRAASSRTASPRVPLRVNSFRVAPPQITSPRPFSPAQNRREVKYAFRTKPTLVDQHHSATRIQATYRGYLARRSFRALRGLVRLQGVVRGQNVQRQTINAMKQMQLLVRVQTQIQSRRLRMLENQSLHYQSYRNDKEAETTPSLNQLARRSFRALRGLVRLQGVVRGQNVQRQTINAMKQMQLLVRVQTQIQSRRLRMLENQSLHYQSYRNDKEAETTPSLNQLSEAGRNEDWDVSLLTKEEIEENLRKKVEATVKRERALAYAYSHQLWKGDPRSAQTPLDLKSNGFPRWWNWMEHQLPTANPLQHQTADKNVQSMAPRPISQQKPSPRLYAIASNNMHQSYALDSYESGTPRSSRSTIPVRAKQFYTPSRTPSRTPPSNSSVLVNNKYTRPTTAKSASTSVFDVPMNDTDSLASCPPLTAPNYMSPTVSAKAKKLRANSNPKERIPGTPGNDSKRRFSFPITPNIASFKWYKEPNQDSASHKVLPRHESVRSIEEISVDSAVSMPAIVGRKPFNRFV